MQSAEIATLKAKIFELETVLGLHDEHLGVVFKLPASLTKLLGLLMATPNVTPDMIQQRLAIATDAKVAVHRLRDHMREWYPDLGITDDEHILIQSRRSLGYWLDPVDKDRIRSLVTPGVTPDPVVVARAVPDAA